MRAPTWKSWWLVSSLLFLLLVCCACILRPSLRARYLFNELATLRLGHSTFDDAQRLAVKIGAEPNGGPCDRSNCEWMVRMNNAELPRWWRGSGETFVVAFDVMDSLVVRKNVGYGLGIERTGTDNPSSVGLQEQEHWKHPRVSEPVFSGWQPTEFWQCAECAHHRYYDLHVYMTPKASTEERRRYTAYNFNCFWKYKGCKEAGELLPTVDPPSDK